MKEECISKIVAMEWEMFQAVTNVGGRATCQDDFETFRIMRSSQAIAWSEAALSSYLEDLAEAQENGRNLLTEKYARMMQSTAPGEYARIQHHLPPLDQETQSLIDGIVEINLAWEEELNANFPYIRRRGRPASSSDDAPHVTSIETYLRGELATYSPRTLAMYYQNVLEQKAANINGAEIVLAAMIQRYGFHSLAAANEAIRICGKAVFCTKEATQRKTLETMPALGKMYAVGDGRLEIFCLADAQAVCQTMSGEKRVFKV